MTCGVRQFSVFFVNGVVVGILCWLLQLGLFWVLPGKNTASYFAASVLAYAIAVVVNFWMQQKVVFGRTGVFSAFVAVALIMTMLVGMLSVIIRDGLAWFVPLELAQVLAFGVAAVAAAPLSYVLTARAAFGQARTMRRIR